MNTGYSLLMKNEWNKNSNRDERKRKDWTVIVKRDTINDTLSRNVADRK